MHITVVAVGLRQPEWADAAVKDYLGRFPKDFSVSVKEVKAEPRAGQSAKRLMELEAERIRKAINKMNDEQEKEALTRYYLLRENNKVIQRKMGVSKAKLYRIYDSALENFEIL